MQFQNLKQNTKNFHATITSHQNHSAFIFCGCTQRCYQILHSFLQMIAHNTYSLAWKHIEKIIAFQILFRLFQRSAMRAHDQPSKTAAYSSLTKPRPHTSEYRTVESLLILMNEWQTFALLKLIPHSPNHTCGSPSEIRFLTCDMFCQPLTTILTIGVIMSHVNHI